MTNEVATPAPGRSGKLPIWAKGLIAAMVLAFFAAVLAISSFINFAANAAKNARQPEYINSVLSSIATFDKLPEGYSSEMAVEALGTHMVTIIHPADKSNFMVGLMSAPDLKNNDPKEMLKQMAEQGIPGLSGGFAAETDGQITVAGKQLDYVAGRSSDKEDGDFSAIIGCIVEKERKMMFLIYGWSESKSFNIESARTLLSSIKSFK